MLVQFLIFFLPLLVHGQNEKPGFEQPIYRRPRLPPRRVPWPVSRPPPVEPSTPTPVLVPIHYERPEHWNRPVEKPVEHPHRPENPSYSRPYIPSRPIPKPITIGTLVEKPPTQKNKPDQPHPSVIMPPRRPVIFLRPSPTLAENSVSKLEPSAPVSELKPDSESVPDLEITVAPNPAPNTEPAPITPSELKPAPAHELSKPERIPVEFIDASTSVPVSKNDAAPDKEIPAAPFEPVLVLQPATASEPSKKEEETKLNADIPEVPIEIPAPEPGPSKKEEESKLNEDITEVPIEIPAPEPEPSEKERVPKAMLPRYTPIDMSRHPEIPPNTRPLLVIPPRPIIVPTLAPIEKKPEPKPDLDLPIDHIPTPQPQPTPAPEHPPHLRPLPILPPRPALRPVPTRLPITLPTLAPEPIEKEPEPRPDHELLPEEPKPLPQPEPTQAFVQPPHLRPLPILPPRPALRPVHIPTPVPQPDEKELEPKPHEEPNPVPHPEPTVAPILPPRPPLKPLPVPLVTVLPTPLPTPALEPIVKEPEPKPNHELPIEPKPAPQSEPTATPILPSTTGLRPVPGPVITLPAKPLPTPVPQPIENEPEPKPDEEIPVESKPAPQPKPTEAPISPPRPIQPTISMLTQEPVEKEPEPRPDHELPEKPKPALQPEPTPGFEHTHFRPILPPRPIPRPIPGPKATETESQPKPHEEIPIKSNPVPWPEPTTAHIINPDLTPKPQLDPDIVEQPTSRPSIDNELRPDEEPAMPKPTYIPIPYPSAVPQPIPFPSSRPPIPTRPPQEIKPTVSNKLPFSPNNKPVSHYIPIMDEPLMDYACKLPNGYFMFENYCDSYIECRENAAFRKICPDGLNYNPAVTWPDFPCSYPTEIKCGSRTVSQPPQPTSECPRQYGYFPINDDDCSKFTMCQEGLATVMNCPAGLVFNPEEGICDWVENVPSCRPNIFHGFVCPAPPIEEDGRPSDMIFKYRYNKRCTEYVACQRGHPRLLSCDRGLRFDEVSEACIDADYVKNCEGQ